MYTYNPLECPEIISIIVANLSVYDLVNYLDINQAWHDSIRYELFRRLDNYKAEYQQLKVEIEKAKDLSLRWDLASKSDKIHDNIFWIEIHQNKFCKLFEWIPEW
ncbi:11470_t:CDS:1 [Funneliformis geosporum]|nr:11470_t:CDS:1 [Funneliformis geosporum]